MKLVLSIIVTLFFITSPVTIWADNSSTESSVSSVAVEVSEVANIVDRLKEKITLFFKFSKEDKADYHFSLVEKRLSELVFVIESGQGDRIEETSSRYSTYLGKFSDFVISNKLLERKERLLDMYAGHLVTLDTVQRNFDFESGLWMLIEHDKNTVKIFSDKIRNI